MNYNYMYNPHDLNSRYIIVKVSVSRFFSSKLNIKVLSSDPKVDMYDIYALSSRLEYPQDKYAKIGSKVSLPIHLVNENIRINLFYWDPLIHYMRAGSREIYIESSHFEKKYYY